MNVEQLTELVDELRYLLARISKYLKNNQYVYLRAFNSWQESYNNAAARLNADKTIVVPLFKLNPTDYSPTGKSIKRESVEKFVRTINYQVGRLEDKIAEINKAAEEKRVEKHPLESFFHRDSDGSPLEPPTADKRIFVAIPPGESALKFFWKGIQPALETKGLSFFRTDHERVNDTVLCELSQELHSCRLAIFNLTNQAPNVMLALGLAYGIGKPVIILQQQNDVTLGKLNNIGYVRYTNATDVKSNLAALLSQLLRTA